MSKAKKLWKMRVRNVYKNFEDLKIYDEMFGIAKRCGFKSAEVLWKENPILHGSVYPEDFGIEEPPATPDLVVVDNCPDAKGFMTLRWADGSDNGNTDVQPIATIYDYEVALLLADAINGRRKPQALKKAKKDAELNRVSV